MPTWRTYLHLINEAHASVFCCDYGICGREALYEIETTERLNVIAGGDHVVVTGSDGGTITAWHSDTGRSVAQWTASAAISALTMTSSPDGQRVVLAGDTSGSVHVLELWNPTP